MRFGAPQERARTELPVAMKPVSVRWAWIGAALAGAVACGTQTAWLPLNDPPHPVGPRPKNEVEVFTASRPAREFVEIGLIKVAIGSNFSSANDFALLDEVRTEGAKRGCDGVVVTDESKLTEGSAYHGTYSSSVTVTNRTSSYRVACVVYK
jgi:hypothetical protein